MVITNIEKFRRASEMTQLQLAGSIGISDGTISNWEKGKGKPGMEAAIKMAEVFACTPQEILEVEDLSAYRRSDGISKPKLTETSTIDESAKSDAGAKVGRNAKKLTETSTIDESAKPRRRAKQAAALADGWED